MDKDMDMDVCGDATHPEPAHQTTQVSRLRLRAQSLRGQSLRGLLLLLLRFKELGNVRADASEALRRPTRAPER